jgi:hypothetical protein
LSYVPVWSRRAPILVASALLLTVPAYAADLGSEGTDLECRVLFRVACAPDFCSQKSPTGGVVGSGITFKYQASDKSVKVCIENLCSMGTMTSDQQQAGVRVLTGSIEWQWFDSKDSDMRVIATGGLGHSGPSFLGTVVSHGEVDDINTIGGDCR